jgi:hypothetical protein
MNSTNHCELFGTLEKLEQFNTLSKNIVAGSLVFESPSPFWGYYSDDPHDNQLLSYIYIAILPTYDVFDVSRASQKVRAELGVDLDAAKADIKFNDRYFNVIRLRHIGGYTNIKQIQESFSNNGITMLMATGNWQNVTAHVKLRKIFGVRELAEGIFIDVFEPNHAYLEIPSKLTFEEFTTVTQKVRNNWLNYKFDAALGAFLMEQKVEEVVRIYSEHLELETLLGIQKLYLQKLARS